MTNNKAEFVWVFFYGTFMSKAVLSRYGITPLEMTSGIVHDFRIQIRPRANLIEEQRSIVFGSIAAVKHADLQTLYSHLKEQYGITYYPYPVLFQSLMGNYRPSLCYMAPEIPDAPPDPKYIEELAACVRELGFPEWYAKSIESFVDQK